MTWLQCSVTEPPTLHTFLAESAFLMNLAIAVDVQVWASIEYAGLWACSGMLGDECLTAWALRGFRAECLDEKG